MNGPVGKATLVTADVSAPGAPTIASYIQVSNVKCTFVPIMPGLDADGSDLTGLKNFKYVTVPGDDPFPNNSFDDIVAQSGQAPVIVAVSDGDAGNAIASQETGVFGIGVPQTVYGCCSDD